MGASSVSTAALIDLTLKRRRQRTFRGNSRNARNAITKTLSLTPEEAPRFDRLVQLLYGVDHIKNLWDGDVRFAAQF